MKTQPSTVERYLPFIFLVIAVHAGLVIWILHHPFRVLNSDLQEVITVDLKFGERYPQAQNRLGISTPRSNHRADNAIAATSSRANQDRDELQGVASSGSPSKQADIGLAGRSVFFNPKPSYPLASRRMGQQGAVHLQLCIGSRGFVESVRLTQSSGYQNLDQSAIEAVKTWRFSALSASPENASECYQLPIHFQLES